jgi:peptidoglycan/LPS O-acetylase OafA/YrhL
MHSPSPPPPSSAHTTENPWGVGYLPSLDGWRALSILLVLGAHTTVTENFPADWRIFFAWLFDGGLGVRCFFIISGFLITTLMLRETASRGLLDLKSFYLRRAVRIFPVYLAFLVAVALLEYFTAFDQSASQWARLLTFTTNFSLSGNWLTGHTWSLACEEQFYLIWPVVFAAVGLQSNRKCMWLLGFLLMLCPLWRVVTYLKIFPDNGLFSGGSLLSNLDTLAFGCLLAYAHPLIGRRLNTGCVPIPWVVVYGVVLILVPYFLQHAHLLGIFTVPFGHTFQAMGLCLLISLSIHQPSKGASRVLNSKPVIWLGQLSYSIYIWQQFFCTNPVVFGWRLMWFQSFPFWILAALGTGITSYYLLERPLLKLRIRLHRSVLESSKTA